MTQSVLLPLSTPAILAFLVNYLAAAEPRVLIPVATDTASTWRYTIDMPHADWTKSDFDDGTWPEGKAGFGVTDYVTPPSTIGTPWTTSDIWLRKTIEVPAPLEFTSAGVIVRHDEDVEMYVGGTLAFSVQGFNTKLDTYDVSKQLKATLKPGKNIVAVHVRQTGGGQYIDLGLVLDPKQKLAVAVTPIDPAELQQARDARWSEDKTWRWYDEQPWPCGFNYIPACAISYTEMWMPYNFDPQTIDKELALAEDAGFNCLRVVLPFVVWEHDPETFKKRLESFVSICDKHGLRVMFTLFDDCAFGSDEKLKNPTYGRQPEVLEGWYANGWTPSPGHDMVRDPTTWPRLEKYVKDIIGAFKEDSRVWVWDLYNEPTNGGLGNVSVPLTDKVFRWARDVDPSQPLTVAQWNGNAVLNNVIFANSDVITFHDYGPAEGLSRHIEDLKRHGRPLINTEWLNRGRGSLVKTCLPVFHKTNVGCMHWGLVNGKTQTDLAWGWRPGMGEPKVWQHDLFHGDGKPYRPEEIKLFQQRLLADQNEQKTP